VKYSEITFEDAGYTLDNVKLDKGIDLTGSRVKIGVFMILSKFIDVIKTFSGAEHTMTVMFDKNVEKDPVEYHSQSIVFQSKTLSIKVSTANISEFDEVTDDMFFNKVFVAADPFTVNVTPDVMKNLLSVSSLLSTSPMQDIMAVYLKEEKGKKMCYVKDDADGTYDYCIGEAIGDGDAKDVLLKIFRYKFASALNGVSTDAVMSFSSTNPNRLLIVSNDGDTKTVISAVRY